MVELKKLNISKVVEKTKEKIISNEVDNNNYQSKPVILKKIKLDSKTNKEKTEIEKILEKDTQTPPKKDKTKSPEELEKEIIKNNLSFQIEKKKLEIISDEISENKLSKDYSLVEDYSSNMDDLLENLNQQTQSIDEDKPFLEFISFLDDKPKINKITISNLDVSNLYAKIDEIEKKRNPKVIQTEYINQNSVVNKDQNSSKDQNKKREKIDIIPLIEKIEIPEIFTLEDDTRIIEAIKDDFVTQEKKPETEKPKEPNFVNSNKQLKPNPEIEEKIKNIKIKADVLKVSTPLNQRHNTIKENNINKKENNTFNYILPKDYLENTERDVSFDVINKEKNKINLIYDSQVKIKNLNINEIHEKYNIDEFTFVNIQYKNNELFYNLIQPELTKSQQEVYFEVKKIFLDSIDTSYYSFKGDKKGVQDYIKKIFDLTLEKSAYDLTNLEKKLYFNFIRQEFSGLGFLASALEDKNILEINCIGADIPIMVYHVKYGLIKTNLKFDKISQLNLFVLSIAKIIGIRVNSNNPVINGYLPNGYKIEGLYSVGDTSNKGSSFIIKKYLEEPLTPINLINLGIGTIDIFTYIWSAMNKDYQIVLTGGDNVLLINSIAQFYPNKNIVSIQSYDYFKFPQKNWIKRLIDNSAVDKNTILTQTISERPDYVVLDEFTKELFNNKWYDLNLTVMDISLIPEYIEKVKTIGINSIVIYLDRIKSKNIEQTQISKVVEIQKGQEQTIIEYIKEEGSFHINLVPSNIDVVDFFAKQKVLRWVLDADISDYMDFNNIVNDYNTDKQKLFRKLNILEKE